MASLFGSARAEPRQIPLSDRSMRVNSEYEPYT
jgi:hypothetical protein